MREVAGGRSVAKLRRTVAHQTPIRWRCAHLQGRIVPRCGTRQRGPTRACRPNVVASSRDLAFRDALHLQLKEYVAPVKREDYERFIGEKSKELAERLEEAKDVMKRLKERE